MTGWRSARALGLGAVGLVGLLLPPTGPAYGDHRHGTPLFTFAGDDVVESSGLVDRGGTVLTINDSGDDAVVYGVDAGTGRTTTRTTYADAVTDVEALAPGAHGTVWAGDIGDNGADRDDVSVYRVRPTGGERPGERYRLAYPDGPRDAETLLVQPRTQRVFVVSKSVFGGTVYAAPRRLRTGDRPNRLTAFAQVPGLVTDGAFLPDGRHVVLRTYDSASVYTFPGFESTGTVRLPAQRQGEGISVGTDGRVLVSSEGLHTEVLRVRLPRAAPRTGSTPAPVSERPHDRAPDPAGTGVAAAVVAGAVAGVGWLTLLLARRRRRRG